MTKEEWIRVRTMPEVPLGVWFSYYKEKGGTYNDAIYFEEAFKKAIRGMVVIDGYGNQVVMNMDTAKRNLFSYYDTIFQI